MTALKKAFALTLLAVLPITAFSNCPGVETWFGGVNGDWNDVNNWSPATCVPGTMPTDTDTAIFGAVVGATSTISLGPMNAISPGLSLLRFNNSTSFTINSNSQANSLQFNGAGPAIQVLAGSHIIAAQFDIDMGSTLNISVVSGGLLTLEQGARGNGSDVIFHGPGNLLNQWNGLGLPAIFNTFELPMGSLSIVGGTFTNSNIIDTPDGTEGTVIVPVDLIINNGTFVHTNSATINDNSVGAQTTPFGNATITSGTLLVSNSGPLVNMVSMAGGVGSLIDVPGQWNVTNSTITLTNTGPIQTATFGAGAEISSNGNMTFTNSTILNQNQAAVSSVGGIGCSIATAGSIFLNGGTLTNVNTGAISPGAFGSVVSAITQIQVNGAVLTNQDTVQTAQLLVGTNGTVTGSGIFQNLNALPTTQVTNGGTVIPGGASGGTMTIGGSYTQTTAGTLVINLASPSSFSQLNVSGAAQLAGALNVNASPSVAGQSFKFLQAGSVGGTFSTIINSGSLVPQIQYFPTYVLVSFLVPRATSYVNYSKALFSAVNQLNFHLTGQMAQLRKRFSMEEVEKRWIAAAEEKTENLLADNSMTIAPNPQVEQKQEQLQERLSDDCYNRPWNVYFGPTGNVGRVLTKKEAAGYQYDAVGALAGFDYAFTKLGVGFMADYDHIDGRGAHQWGKFDINQAHGSLYVTYIRNEEKQLAFNMIVGGGYDWYNIRRNTLLGTATGKPHGVELDALAGMEYTFENRPSMPDNLKIIPLLNLQYMYLHVNKYKEHGAGVLDMSYQSQNVRSVRSTLGARINHSWEYENVSFKPEINLAWQWEYLDKSRQIGTSAGGIGSHLTFPQAGRSLAMAGVDFLVTLFDKYGIEASYEFEWNSLYLDHFFYLGCDFRF